MRSFYEIPAGPAASIGGGYPEGSVFLAGSALPGPGGPRDIDCMNFNIRIFYQKTIMRSTNIINTFILHDVCVPGQAACTDSFGRLSGNVMRLVAAEKLTR